MGPRERLAGFVIARRAIDKMPRQPGGNAGGISLRLSTRQPAIQFQGITGEQFEAVVQGSTDHEEVGTWLQANGRTKTPVEIKTWSDEKEAGNPMKIRSAARTKMGLYRLSRVRRPDPCRTRRNVYRTGY